MISTKQGMYTTEQIVDLVIWLTLSPYPIFMILLYKNRFMYPIKGRFPRIGLIQAFFVYFFGTIHFLFIMLGFNCKIYNWILFFCTAGAQDTLNFRLFQLLFAYEVTQNISELKDNRNFKEWKLNWFTRHRHFFQDKYQMRLELILVSVRLILVVIFESLPTSICVNSSWGLMYGMLAGGMSVVSLIIAIKMWKYPRDAFGIKKEFAFQVYGSFLNIVVFYGISLIATNLKWAVKTGILASCHTVLYFILIPPYLESVRYSKKTDYLAETKTLEQWLKRPEGIKLFLEYLKTEFSSENLLFYLDVLYFKALPFTDFVLLKDEISQMYQKFIERESPLALNLPDDVIEYTGNTVQQILATPAEEFEKIGKTEIFGIYDRAQKEIYMLMASDSYHRFQQSKEFLKVKDELARGGSNHDSKSELDQLLGKEETAMVAVNLIREEARSVHSPSKGSQGGSHGSHASPYSPSKSIGSPTGNGGELYSPSGESRSLHTPLEVDSTSAPPALSEDSHRNFQFNELQASESGNDLSKVEERNEERNENI